MMRSLYSSALSINSESYSRSRCSPLKYYFESLEIQVMMNGYYRFHSETRINTHGYFHRHLFDPLDPSIGRLVSNESKCGDGQFPLRFQLEANTTYVLVVTTASPKMSGNFSVIATGPALVIFNRTSEYTNHIKTNADFLNNRHGVSNRQKSSTDEYLEPEGCLWRV